MPQISILMSTYNECEKYIRQSVESILAQTFKDFELIVINDNPARDDVKSILDSYNDTRIIYSSNDFNMGLAMSMNKAAALAKAELLARMDSDDMAEPNRLSEEIRIIKECDVDFVFSSFVHIDEESNLIPEIKANESNRFGSSLAKAISNNPSIVHHPTVLMRRRLFDKVGGYRNFPCSQDADLWLRLQEVGCRFYYIGEPLLKYRINSKSISQRKWFLQRLTWYYIFDLSIERIKRKGCDSFSVDYYHKRIESMGLNNEIEEKKLRKAVAFLQRAQESNKVGLVYYRIRALMASKLFRNYKLGVLYKLYKNRN